MKSIFNDFIGLYPVSKTIRMELRPVGKTLENIEKNGLIPEDQDRADKYKLIKPLIDDYHRRFIDEVLGGAELRDLEWEKLGEAIARYQKDKDEKARKELEKIQKSLRSAIAKAFTSSENYKKVFGKELFTQLLPEYWEKHPVSEDSKDACETFSRFTTYFTGFHENRKNIYSADKEGVSIPWRIVNENFPKFLNNIQTFEKIKKECPELIAQAERELKPILGEFRLKDPFSVDFFSQVMTQQGIDFYNQVLGGVSETMDGEKQKGFNEVVNLWNQQHPENRYPKFTLLFKQILSDRQSSSFTYDLFESDSALLNAVNDFYSKKDKQTRESVKDVISETIKLLKGIRSFDLKHVYIGADSVTEISHQLFGSWSYIRNLISEEAQLQSDQMRTKADKNKKFKQIDDAKYYDLAFIDELVSKASETSDTPQKKSILGYWAELSDIQSRIKDSFNNFKTNVFQKKDEYTTGNPLRSNEPDVEIVKNFLDSVMDFFHRVKALVVPDEFEKDMEFYAALDESYEALRNIIPLYNLVRSTLTKKVGEVEKFKLNFENPTLANGWDENKEQDNTCIILLKDNQYYLGILNARNKPKTTDLSDKLGGDCYQKMTYKLLPGPNKMLPKVFFSEKGLATFNPPQNILRGYRSEKHKKGDAFDRAFCHELIDYFKSAIAEHPDWKYFDFKFSDTKSYEDISGFYREIEKQGYKITFRNVSAKQIDQWVDEGKLFLFQIYCKDFAPGATGRKNLHTLYWEQLFSKQNLKDVVFKLDGEAELFYRPKSSNEKNVVHKQGGMLVNKRLEDGTPVPEDIYEELYKFFNKIIKASELSDEAKAWKNRVTVKPVKHPIVKDKRYTQDQFQIHLKTKINFKAEGNANLNDLILQTIKNNPNVNIIGLDRGERNLIYLTVVNQKGQILFQKSLNTVGENRQMMDYQARLNDREKTRDANRKSWKTIGKIKELKEGYLSQVVHEIVTLMVQYNAIVVMENLNVGFKRGRFHVEKQVYQKFENALVEKLNYLVFKDRQPDEPGGLLKGYQLTPKDDKKNNRPNQMGAIFYVPAGYTSKIDPATGFVNRLRLDDRINESQKLYGKMNSIRYNAKENYFEFTFDYSKMVKQEKPVSRLWTVCTYGDKRIAGRKDKDSGRWIPEDVNVTERLKQLFDKYDIEYKSGQELKDTIANQDKGEFFKTLNWLLKLTLQMRYSRPSSAGQSEEDYILSPIRGKDGTFFDSREYMEISNAAMPKDADANGAYHIALKGLWALQNGIEEDKSGKCKTKPISNDEWFTFAVERHEKKR